MNNIDIVLSSAHNDLDARTIHKLILWKYPKSEGINIIITKSKRFTVIHTDNKEDKRAILELIVHYNHNK